MTSWFFSSSESKIINIKIYKIFLQGFEGFLTREEGMKAELATRPYLFTGEFAAGPLDTVERERENMKRWFKMLKTMTSRIC